MDYSSIRIRPIELEDFEAVLEWSKDEAFCSANDWEMNRNRDELYQWWLRCVHNQAKDFIRAGFEWNDRLIGYADLACIDSGSTELGIAIGESSLWGNGIGSYVLDCVMEYAVNKLGITTFTAETHETNIRSRRMLEKLGFTETSRNGEDLFLIKQK